MGILKTEPTPQFEFTDIFNALLSSVALVDSEGIIREVNQGWREFAQANDYNGPDLGVGLNYLKIAEGNNDPELLPLGLASEIKNVLDGRSESFSYDYPCHAPNKPRWFRMLVRSLRRYHKSYAVIIHFDITAQKLAEISLRRQAEIVDVVQDAIMLVDLNHTIMFANRAAAELYGYSIDEMIGRRTTDIFTTESEEALTQRRSEMREHKGWSGQLTHRRKNGQEVNVAARWRIVTNETGSEEILKIHTDMSALSQLIRAQRMQTVGQMAGGIAHDLNNILTPMMLAAETVRQSRTEPQPELGERLVNLTERASDLIKQLLGFARGFGGQQLREPVIEMLGEVQKMLNFSLPSTVDVVFHSTVGAAYVYCNKTQVHQVIMNLCLNASDAMDRRGSIEVHSSIEDLKRKKTMFGELQDGRYLVLKVTDTGSGMSADQIERAFEPFYTTKEFGKGAGLGLSTCAGILKNHNGYIEVESKLGTGSTFVVYIPVDSSKKSDGLTDIVVLTAEKAAILETAGKRPARVLMTDAIDECLSILISAENPIRKLIVDAGLVETESDPDVYWESMAQYLGEGELIVVCDDRLSPERRTKLENLGAKLDDCSATSQPKTQAIAAHLKSH